MDSAQVDLFIGLFVDLDVGNPAAEKTGGTDPIDELVHMTDGSGVYAGLKRLHADQVPDVSVGPFGLESGENNEVVIALVGGISLSDLCANADQVQIKYIEVTQSPAGLEDHNRSFSVARLFPNTPNPFDPQTTVCSKLERTADVSLVIYETQGCRVRLVEGIHREGSHSLIWDGGNERGWPVSNGIYFLRKRSGVTRGQRRMTVL